MSSTPTQIDPRSNQPRPTIPGRTRRPDRWRAADPTGEAGDAPPGTETAPRQFDPTCRARLPNTCDEENEFL